MPADLVLMDTGRRRRRSQRAPMPAAAFEFSGKRSASSSIAACRRPARENWRQVARTTAAHSTVTLNERHRAVSRLGPLAHAVRHAHDRRSRQVTVAREEQPDGVLLRARTTVMPTFSMSSTSGCSCSRPGPQARRRGPVPPRERQAIPADRDQFALRFHLHPSIKANRVADGHSAVLLMPNKEAWNTTPRGSGRTRGERLSCRSRRPAAHLQLVIYGRARKIMRVQWAFSHVPHLAPGAKRQRGPEPQLPL